MLGRQRCRRTPHSRFSRPRPTGARSSTELGGEQRQRLRRDQRAAGRASRRCQAEPGRACAHGRPGGRNGRGARNRLAAGAGPGVRQQRIQPGSPGYFEATSRAESAGEAGAPRSLARRYPSAGQSARPARSAQHRDASRRRSPSACRSSIGAHAQYYAAARQGFRYALAGRDPALGEQGRAAQGRACRRHASRPGVSVPLARTGGGRCDRAEARHAADRGLSRPARDEALRIAAAHDHAAMRTTIRRRGTGCRSACTRPVVVLPFSVGGTPEAKDLFGLFDDTINRLLAVLK